VVVWSQYIGVMVRLLKTVENEDFEMALISADKWNYCRHGIN
jgi:hypothetical protein